MKYCYWVIRTADPEYWRGINPEPVSVLHNGVSMYGFFRLTGETLGDDALVALMAKFEMKKDDTTPLPGNGWKLIHLGPKTRYTAQSLQAAFVDHNARTQGEGKKGAGKTSEKSGNVIDFSKVREAIEDLGTSPDPEEVRRIIKNINAQTDGIKKAILTGELKRKAKLDSEAFKAESAQKPEFDTSLKHDKEGRLHFSHAGAPDELLLTAAFYAQAEYWNGLAPVPKAPKRVQEPLLTCLLDTPCVLRKSNHQARFVDLSEPAFRGESRKMLVTHHIDEHGIEGPAKVLSASMSSVVYHGLWEHVPPTPELIHAPVIAPDGSVIDKPGWHYRKSGV